MSARKFTMKETVDRVLDSDFDPGEATQESQDEGDTSAHESQDEADNSGDTNILARRENTDYVDRVIRKDAAVQVKAHQRGHGDRDRDSDSSFDHSSEFEKDETSPPQTLQELRGKKKGAQHESTGTCFCQCDCRESCSGTLPCANQHHKQSWCCYSRVQVQIQKS